MNQSENNKDLITSEDVKKSLSGDEQAIIEQLERARQVALEQLEARKKGIQSSNPNAAQKTQQELEAELAKREAELKIAKQKAGLLDDSSDDMKKKAQAVEMDIKQRANPIDTTRNLNIDNVEVKPGTDQKPVQPQPVNVQPTTKTVSKQELKKQKALAKKKEQEARALAKKKAKEEKKANSNFKYVMTVILFIGLFALVYFLPEISSYMSAYQANKAKEKNELITTGNLYCSMKTYNKKYDLEYESTFSFTDSKLTRLTYKAKTKGDATKDEEELTEMNEKCNILKQQTKKLDGITVTCSLNDGTNINTQTLDYKYIDVEKVTASYAEAEGVYPSYKYNENIDKIEKNMKAAGYTCERTR